MSRVEAEKRIEDTSQSASGVDWTWFVIEKKDGAKIGFIIHFTTQPSGHIEIGYALVPSEKGKGYGTEALQIMVDYLFLTRTIMRIKVPSKKVRERFLLIYELEGCQKAVNSITEYYGVRRMRIVLDGRRAGNGNIASYFENNAYFTKRGLTKQTVLHELYHHLVYVNGLDISKRTEEKDADRFARGLAGRLRQ
jgi:hypothetical protein